MILKVSLLLFPLSEDFGGGYKVVCRNICPALLEGLRSFLRVSTVLVRDTKFWED